MKALSQQRSNHRACDNGEKCCEFEDAVAPGQQFVRQEFGKQAVFRGAEERGLRASQENHGIRQSGVAPRESVHGEKHCASFEDLCRDRHASFAKTVRKVSACHGKQEERESKEIPNDKNQEIFLRIRGVGPEDQENDKEFQAVVVEGALELRSDQTPKAEPPLFFALRYREIFVDRHARSPKRCD